MSVVLFEAISIFWAVADMLFWRGESVFGELAVLLVVVGLTLWVTRGRSRVARLIYTVLGLFGLTALGAAYASGYIPSDLLPSLALMVGVFASLVLLSLLWWPSSTAWLKANHDGT